MTISVHYTVQNLEACLKPATRNYIFAYKYFDTFAQVSEVMEKNCKNEKNRMRKCLGNIFFRLYHAVLNIDYRQNVCRQIQHCFKNRIGNKVSAKDYGMLQQVKVIREHIVGITHSEGVYPLYSICAKSGR